VATGRTHRPATRSRGIPEATVARLPLYLRALTALSERSVPTVSSEELAAAAGVNSAKLRKDFSYLGSSQPNSSQSSCDNARDEEGAVERAFWQSTPTALEELRQGTEDECHQGGAFLLRLS